jgi:uncharacterized protein
MPASTGDAGQDRDHAPRPLPFRPRPAAGETATSYVRRLARANHLRPGYLRRYLRDPGDPGQVRLDWLAATMSPTHLAVERRDLPGLRDLLDAGHDVEDDNGDGWTLLRHAINAEYDIHARTGQPLHADITAFLLARGADPLRQRSGLPVVAEAETRGHWLAAEIMRTWIRRGQNPATT